MKLIMIDDAKYIFKGFVFDGFIFNDIEKN